MQRPRIIVASIVVALAAAGGITAAAVDSSTASAAPAGHSATASTVRTAQAAVGGHMQTILTTASGQPLYYYQPDTAAKSFVSGGLAVQWPPLTSSAPTGAGVNGRLGVLSDAAGQQVTYNGHPLYTFIDDHAGQVTGQGVQNFFVATAGLAPIGSVPAPGSAVTPAGSAGGSSYGY